MFDQASASDHVSAPGWPGIPATWTSSAKDLVTSALGASRVWVTLGHGIVNEVYWPSTGQPQVRDLGFIIAGDHGWREVKRVAKYALSTPRPDVPLARVVHEGDGYRLELEVVPDPLRDSVLVAYRLEGAGLRLYVLFAPHLGGAGEGNSAWTADGLVAQKGPFAACLLNNAGFTRASAGFVGHSDGWQDFAHNGRMTWIYARADNGNVALTGELPTQEGVLCLGLAGSVMGARTLARSSLSEGLATVRNRFVEAWQHWGEALTIPQAPPEVTNEAYISATVLKVHEDRTYAGAVVASLSVPWGNSNNSSGGYHLVWVRDAVEAGFGLLAVGQHQDACRMLSYLIATQSDDGHWSQNYFSDGRPYWGGIQLDEVGFPILLASKLLELDAGQRMSGVDAMIRQAAGFLVRTGPVSPQDRWEENAGISPFTLAVEIVALVEAAEWLEGAEQSYVLSLADYWNERVEDWTYIEDGAFDRRFGTKGHYVRIAPAACAGGPRGRIDVKNRGGEVVQAADLVGLDYLYLLRLGLRQADDPRMQDTLKIVERLLRIDTPLGPAYRRYNEDGYGECEDGSPFVWSGIGRGWPLLTGERGHLELKLGKDPLPYLEAMARMTGPGGLIPEQVWDEKPIPERALYPGKPSGSAMPLVWAHAEFLKLLRAREQGRPLELLKSVESRYQGERPAASCWHWRRDTTFEEIPPDREILIESLGPFVLHVGFDGWQSAEDRRSRELAFGVHGVRLARSELAGRRVIDFTFYYAQEGQWEGVDHHVRILPATQ